MSSTPVWTARLVAATESILTWRARRKARKKIRQQKKHVIVDWIEAFLWAAGVVLLINQYLLQAYRIPTGSMIETLLLEDRIFVNKMVYGPELLPGIGKLPGFVEPQRGEVVIFENPSYISRGPVFNIVQRVLYMVTLSLVDIDRDESGEPRAHFLIKRAVGFGGDRIRSREGDLQIRPIGQTEWLTEQEFARQTGTPFPIRRMITASDYASYRPAAQEAAREILGLAATTDGRTAQRAVQAPGSIDPFEFDRLRSEFLLKANPSDERTVVRHSFYELGWYVPPNTVLTLGDNRDNSRDGRYYGPVRMDRVLGRAMFRYWPLPRVGAIR